MENLIENLGTSPLVERVRNILLTPKTEWPRIDRETTGPAELYRRYAMVLAAIGPVCSLIGSMAFGWSFLGVSLHPSFMAVLSQSVVTYVLSLVSLFLLAWLINLLAPTFGGQRNFNQALKVAVYSATASWIVGVFGLLPALSALSILGLYSLYLLFLGLPCLMKTPEAKALPYTASIIAIGVVVGIVLSAVLIPLRAIGGGSFAAAAIGSSMASGSAPTIAGASIDAAKLQAMADQVKTVAAASQTVGTNAAGATATAVDPEVLKQLLPASLDGFDRSNVAAGSLAAGGMGGSHAEADYERGDSHITLEVSDVGVLGTLATVISVNSSKETANGYEKIATADGRTISEEYDRANRSGKYSVLAGGRMLVAANGVKVSMEELKGAVAVVGLDKVEALAKH